MHRENVDLSAMARSIADELRSAEPGRQVEFTIETDLTATGDFQLLRAAMENLFHNSWKYTSAHRVPGSNSARASGAVSAHCSCVTTAPDLTRGMRTVYSVPSNGFTRRLNSQAAA
jgi:signal transduction histidine kinase